MKPSALRRHTSVSPGRGITLPGYHPALTGARTIFPSRVYDPSEVARVLKTGHQSRKIGKVVVKGHRKGWPIFTLTLEERATCPRSCEQFAGCYGNNMQAAERIVAGEPLVAALAVELAALQARHPGGFMVRLHVLGDFTDLAYVDAWRGFLERFSALHVFGFTAHAPASGIGRLIALTITDFGWARFAVRFSGAPHENGAARVLAPGESDPDAILCPAQTGATDCCATCALCWQSPRSIAFRRH